MGKLLVGAAFVCWVGNANATLSPSEVVTLPTGVDVGGGDKVDSQLIGATYNAGDGPGIWIVADGGYRLYHNGALLAEDNQAGRVRFVPMTFLPGENAISVVGVNGSGAPGVMVQIDDLDKSYYSGSSWKAKPSVGDASWKNKGRNLSQWGNATALSYANNKMPSGGALNGFAPNTQSKWIWTGSESDENAILLFTFNIKAEGFGAVTTGGDAGKIVVAKDTAAIISYLRSNDPVTILVPEGTYDFRKFRNAVTEAKSNGRTWCSGTCKETNRVTGKHNKFYRINFQENSCAGITGDISESSAKIVSESDNLQQWDNWITVRGNKTLIGMGRGANLRGASLNNRWNEGGHNNIYRNLAIYDVNPHLVEASDGLETSGDKDHHIKNFWADHISYKWVSDGMDMEFVDNATISYTDLDGGNEHNCWGWDPYMALVEDAHLTYANNYWHNTYGRVPKVTGENNGSQVHLYNQYVDKNSFFIAGASGHSGSAKAYVRYENSYVDNGSGYLAEISNYGYVYMSGVTLGSSTRQRYRNNGTEVNGIPQGETFVPSYNFEKRTVANLPKEIPSLAGVGGRYGKMPEYNQAFGLSKKAAEVTLSAPAAGAKIEAGTAVTLTAAKSAGDGSVKSVDFYIGNDKVGSATASPFQVTATGLPAGVYSAVAVVTDNNGLIQMSPYVTFEVVGETYPEITKCGAGPSSQSIELGQPIVDFCYTWSGAETVTVEGFPKGITASVDNSMKRVSISGTPAEAGTFAFKVFATNNDSTFAKNGKIVVTDPNAPASSSSQEPTVESSSSATTDAFVGKASWSTEAETGYYRIFDMQGRPLFAGERKPAKMPAARVVVVEYVKAQGRAIRRYIQSR